MLLVLDVLLHLSNIAFFWILLFFVHLVEVVTERLFKLECLIPAKQEATYLPNHPRVPSHITEESLEGVNCPLLLNLL